MASEAVQAYHLQPGVNGVEGAGGVALVKVALPTLDFPESRRVEEDEEFIVAEGFLTQRDIGQSMGDFFKAGWIEAGGAENGGEGIDVVPGGAATAQGGLNEGGAAPHEGVINEIARLAEPRNEEVRELWFVAGAVGDFVEGVAGPLFGGPEFVHKNRDFSSLRSVRFRDLRGAAKIVEGT